MSESADGRRRRRRSDAERSAAVVLDAAVRILGRHPDATVEQIAAEAGVTRQTVYAHYPSRPSLINAVVGRITAEAVAALDATEGNGGTVAGALLRWLDVTWQLFERYPLLRHPSAAAADTGDLHAPVAARLERMIRRGRITGEFDGALGPEWLVAATVALGHAAGGEVAAGRMTEEQAAAVLHRSVLRLYGAHEP